MDPDANLAEQRALAASIQDLLGDRAVAPDYAESDQWRRDAVTVFFQTRRLAELVQALDEWLTKGGAWPNPWC